LNNTEAKRKVNGVDTFNGSFSWTRAPEISTSKECITAEELNQALESYIRERYSGPDKLPYHNWDHVQETRRSLRELAARCRQYGIDFDFYAVDNAALCHDLLFWVEHEPLGFRSKEELAGDYSFNLLRQLGGSVEHAEKVRQIVYATHARVTPENIEEIIMRAADLKGLTADYKVFKQNTLRLHEEHRLLSGDELSFDDFAKKSLNHLALYAIHFFNLTPSAFTDGSSDWHKRVLENAIALLSDVMGGREKIGIDVILDVDKAESIPEKPTGATLLIGIGKDLEILQQILDRMQATLSSADGVCFMLPYAGSQIPIKDEAINRWL